MIKYEWRTELSPAEADELSEVLTRAAAYDAEPGYSTIDFADVAHSMADPKSPDRHLVIWMLPHGTALTGPPVPECIAGLVRLTGAASGSAEATVVIDPDLRSIGIMTLLLERVGLDANSDHGWLGSGAKVVTAWARGNHPASGRLSNRFLIPRTRRIWKLLRSTHLDKPAAAPVLEPITDAACTDLGWYRGPNTSATPYAMRESGRIVAVARLNTHPVDSDEFGWCATIDDAQVAPSAGPEAGRQLLDGVAALAHEAELTGLIIHLDSDDTTMVHHCRLAGFQHDRTDVRFHLGGTSHGS